MVRWTESLTAGSDEVEIFQLGVQMNKLQKGEVMGRGGFYKAVNGDGCQGAEKHRNLRSGGDAPPSLDHDEALPL